MRGTMGDTFKVVGQREVGRCPGWRDHPWTSASDLFGVTGWKLCARYGISRKTGYKWLAHFDEGSPRSA
jgi:hypothetical protein